MQDAILAMLAKEPAHGYDLGVRLRRALGPLGESMNAGQVYVTLGRLEKAGLVVHHRADGQPARPDRKVYELTEAGQRRVAAWLSELKLPKPDLVEFHLKVATASAGRLADPTELVAAQRHALRQRLHEVQRAVLGEPEGSTTGLLLEGIALRLQADLRWLDACDSVWANFDNKSEEE
ncbi:MULTISPECIES: PadR family transcriptional regulator [unclassified Streptomyces]|jgi:DNA-binding PadR family transcriptional regulator|uniref:PadR family transcriptional regulator n=1 Tax=unclassified Streptomyces TaxID=2593676 RepID=UPI000D3BC3DC|nr:PadR family transcriptional regulator [Streptomyces sp. VMFN-G11Ma]PTM96864.1 PadR family transcriptional regulator [Streptomyces sp. VMFN-G11Ma]